MSDVFEMATIIARKGNQIKYRERMLCVQRERLSNAKAEYKNTFNHRNGYVYIRTFGARLTKEEYKRQIEIVSRRIEELEATKSQLERELTDILKTKVM